MSFGTRYPFTKDRSLKRILEIGHFRTQTRAWLEWLTNKIEDALNIDGNVALDFTVTFQWYDDLANAYMIAPHSATTPVFTDLSTELTVAFVEVFVNNVPSYKLDCPFGTPIVSRVEIDDAYQIDPLGFDRGVAGNDNYAESPERYSNNFMVLAYGQQLVQYQLITK